MKLVHSLALSCALLLLLALGPASIAGANALHLESCMEGGECDTASSGTTFQAKGKVTLQNGFLEDTCTSEIKGEAVATLSKNAEEDIEAEVTEASYTSCSEGTALAQGLSWTLTTDFVQFPEALVAGGVKFILHIGGEAGDCTFEEDATHMPNVAWKNSKPTTLKVSGSLKKVSGVSTCGAEANLSGSYELSSVSDSKLPGATNLQILEGPTMAEELAEVRLETCHESKCALASKGTFLIFNTPFSKKFTLQVPPFTNPCAFEFEGEVLSPVANSKEALELEITRAELRECTFGTLFVNEATLPWSMTTTVEEFEAGSQGLLSGGVLIGWKGLCGFQESAKDKIHWKYISSEEAEEENGPLIELSGSLVAEGECTALATTLGTFEIGFFDPELSEATSIRITD